MTARTIAHYSIAAPLGAGGMGEVFRARDTRLQRDVAIKILPAAFVAHPDRLRRFDQETKTLAALNHPNILTIHDAGVHEATPYLVSELLEGRTLREEIASGPLPLRKAIDYARQIAEGLAAAHSQGIVHRDLKPENLFLTKDSRVKILDFGLAKLNEAGPAPSVPARSAAPTLAHSTLPGQILGTPSYMAPEQVRGEPADHRSDIFSFGCVLFEMLAGARAFQRDTSVSTMHAILSEEPPALAELNQRVTPVLERLVAKCLAKDPEDRWQTAKDLADELRWIGQSSSETALVRPTIPARGGRFSSLLAIAGLALALLLSLAFHFIPRAGAKGGELRRLPVSFSLPPQSELAFSAVSPDGRHIAFSTYNSRTGLQKLWLRSLDSLETKVLSEEGSYPFWSPDSRFVAFFANRKLKKINIAGGPAQFVCTAEENWGGAWNRAGLIIFSDSATSPIRKVSAEGGEPLPLTTLKTDQPNQEEREINHIHPQFLPDGEHFIFFARTSNHRHSAVYAGSLDGKVRKLLLKTRSNACYAAPGYLLYILDSTLVAQKFDARSLQISGEPVPLAQNVKVFGPRGESKFTISDTGVLIYQESARDPSQLIWVDRAGKELARLPVTAADRFESPWLSKNETRAILRKTVEDAAEFWTVDSQSGALARISGGAQGDWYPLWHPDGEQIVYASNRKGQHHLYLRPASGGEERIIHEDPDPVRRIKIPCDITPDGRQVLFYMGRSWRLYLAPLDGSGPPVLLRPGASGESSGVFSPDGRWVAFTSDESGISRVTIQSYPAAAQRHQISIGPSFHPRWNPNGREIFFIVADKDKTLMAADFDSSGNELKIGAPKALFGLSINDQDMRAQYSPASNGERFLIFGGVGERDPDPGHAITVVLNWTEILKK